MALDPSISLNVRPFQMPNMDPSEALVRAVQLKALLGQDALRQVQLGQLQAAQQERQALRQVLRDPARLGTPAQPAVPGTPAVPALAPTQIAPGRENVWDPKPGTLVKPGSDMTYTSAPVHGQPAIPGRPAVAATPGWDDDELDRRAMAAAPTLWPEMKNKLMDLKSKEVQMQKDFLAINKEKVDLALRGSSMVRDQETYDIWRQQLVRAGVNQRLLDPVYSPAAVQRIEAAGVTMFQKLDLADKQIKQDETARHNRATEQTAKSREQREAGEVTYVEDAEGNLVPMPKYGGPQGGVATGPGGQPLQTAKGRERTTAVENQLRDEHRELTKNFREVRDALGRITSSGMDPTPAGDLSLIYAYAKMLDPQTGVRNEEVRNIATTGGLPQQMQYWIEWAKGKQKLPDAVRADFLKQSQMLYEQYTKDYAEVDRQYQELARRKGVNPANVVLDFRSTVAGKRPVTWAQIDQIVEGYKARGNNSMTREQIADDFRREGHPIQ